MGEGIFRRTVIRLRFKVQPALLHSLLWPIDALPKHVRLGQDQ